MARGGQGLPKVSHGLTMPNLSTPCGRATPEIALRLFQGWPARKAGGLRPSSTPLDTSRCTPKTYLDVITVPPHMPSKAELILLTYQSEVLTSDLGSLVLALNLYSLVQRKLINCAVGRNVSEAGFYLDFTSPGLPALYALWEAIPGPD